jgi:hypothetical protein
MLAPMALGAARELALSYAASLAQTRRTAYGDAGLARQHRRVGGGFVYVPGINRRTLPQTVHRQVVLPLGQASTVYERWALHS